MLGGSYRSTVGYHKAEYTYGHTQGVAPCALQRDSLLGVYIARTNYAFFFAFRAGGAGVAHC